MKHLRLSRLVPSFGLLLLVPASVGCPDRRVQPPTKPDTLLVVTLNDFHGQLDPMVVRSYETPPRTLRVGGAEALVATVGELRRTWGKRMLLLDAGDFMQGSALSNSFEGAPVLKLFRRLGVDAAAIGNHEFDFGPAGPVSTGGKDPRGALKAWAKAAPFPVLSANLARKDGRKLGWPNVSPAVLLDRGGVKVGVIGLTTTTTPSTTHPLNIGGLVFRDYLPLVKKWSRALRGRGAEVVVLLAHVGGGCRSRDPQSCNGPIARLVRGLPRGTVDAVVAGHSHSCMWHRINGVPVVQACSRGKALGRIEITRGPRGWRGRALPPEIVCHDVFSDSGSCEARLRTGARRGKVVPNRLLQRFAPAVKPVRAMLARYRARLSPKPDAVVTQVARAVAHPRFAPSPMGKLLTDVIREAVVRADVALMNSGGVRGSFKAGPLTYADVFRVFPFDNYLAVAELTGRELRQVMTDYLSREGAGFLAVSGLQIRIRCGRPLTLTGATVGGRPIDDAKTYRVALSDFLLAGGVGFRKILSKVPAARKRILGGRLVRDALVAYLKRLGHPLNDGAHPVTPTVAVENGPCRARARKRKPRPLCR